MDELANDPANPCIGCGPANPLGLRLRFRREGDAVRGELATTDAMQGWPGRVHSGVLYMALLETANWTVYGLTGRVGAPVRTGPLEGLRLVPTGTRLALEGRLASAPDAVPLVVRAAARTSDGGVVARLERALDFPGRAELARRLGYEDLPELLAEAFPT